MDNILRKFAKQRPILIQTVKEFTDLISSDPESLDYIKQYLSQLQPLGIGGMGQIYLVSGETVLKEIHVCGADGNSTDKLCQLAKEGSVILTIPSDSRGIGIHIMPNYLSEFYIGLLLADMSEKHGVGFPKIYGQIFDPNSLQKTMYILMEKLDPYQLDLRNTRYILDLIALLISIHHAQRFLRFTHYDMHWGNIMSKPRRSSDITYTVCADQDTLQITLPGMSALPYIIDFGYSVASATKPNGRIDIIPRSFSINVIDVPVFDMYFDALTLLGNLINKLCTMLDVGTREEYMSYFGTHQEDLSKLERLVHCFFNPEIPLAYIFENYYYFVEFNNFQVPYKPRINKIYQDSQAGTVAFTPFEIIVNLIKIESNLGISMTFLKTSCTQRADRAPTRKPDQNLF